MIIRLVIVACLLVGGTASADDARRDGLGRINKDTVLTGVCQDDLVCGDVFNAPELESPAYFDNSFFIEKLSARRRITVSKTEIASDKSPADAIDDLLSSILDVPELAECQINVGELANSKNLTDQFDDGLMAVIFCETADFGSQDTGISMGMLAIVKWNNMLLQIRRDDVAGIDWVLGSDEQKDLELVASLSDTQMSFFDSLLIEKSALVQ